MQTWLSRSSIQSYLDHRRAFRTRTRQLIDTVLLLLVRVAGGSQWLASTSHFTRHSVFYLSLVELASAELCFPHLFKFTACICYCGSNWLSQQYSIFFVANFYIQYERDDIIRILLRACIELFRQCLFVSGETNPHLHGSTEVCTCLSSSLP